MNLVKSCEGLSRENYRNAKLFSSTEVYIIIYMIIIKIFPHDHDQYSTIGILIKEIFNYRNANHRQCSSVLVCSFSES